ncbi:hypothetical protein JCM8097_005850 [Rhodosporidiobolus ruineniae]
MQLPDEKHRLEFPSLPGVYGFVTVDGQPLEVYGVEEKARKTIAYVESKEGKQFEVWHYDGRRGNPMDHVVRLFVDGTRVHGRVNRSNEGYFLDPANAASRFVSFQGKELDNTSIAPFLFTKLTMTDNDQNACKDEDVIKGIGSVQLRYWRVENLRTSSSSTFTSSQTKPIHERSKKATLSHMAGFAPPISTTQGDRLTYDWYDYQANPLSVLEFRYRSRALLQFAGHIPATPPPERSPSSELDELDSSNYSASASPAVAGPSNPRRAASSSTATGRSLSPSSEAARIAELKAEYESLRRQERLAQIQRELGTSCSRLSPSSSSSQQPSQKQIKREPAPLSQDELKKIKLEEGAAIEREKAQNKKKGKALEVIDLCDSD